MGSRRERFVVDDAGGVRQPDRRGDPIGGVGPSRAPPVDRLRITPKASIRTVVLDRFAVGLRGDQPADIRSVRTGRIRIRSYRITRPAPRAVRPVLGGYVFAGGFVRGISAAWLLPIHAGARPRLLARGDHPVGRIRIDSFAKRRGTLERSSGCGTHRHVLLSHPTAHRQSLVRGWFPRRVGLGRNFLLLRARQRNGFSRSPVEFFAARPGLAQRRVGGPGRKRSLLRRNRIARGCVRSNLSEASSKLCPESRSDKLIRTCQSGSRTPQNSPCTSLVFPSRPILIS